MVSLILIFTAVSNWLANALVVGTFLSMVEEYGAADTFSIYTVICVMGVLWIYLFIPETKLLDAITIRVRYTLRQITPAMISPMTCLVVIA